MSTGTPARFKLALSSLDTDVNMLRLARMLVTACEEVLANGGVPEQDAAVAVLSGRIGFASPADTMSEATWSLVVKACENEENAVVRIKPDMVQ